MYEKMNTCLVKFPAAARRRDREKKLVAFKLGMKQI